MDVECPSPIEVVDENCGHDVTRYDAKRHSQNELGKHEGFVLHIAEKVDPHREIDAKEYLKAHINLR